MNDYTVTVAGFRHANRWKIFFYSLVLTILLGLWAALNTDSIPARASFSLVSIIPAVMAVYSGWVILHNIRKYPSGWNPGIIWFVIIFFILGAVGFWHTLSLVWEGSAFVSATLLQDYRFDADFMIYSAVAYILIGFVIFDDE